MRYIQSIHIPSHDLSIFDAINIINNLFKYEPYNKMHMSRKFYKFKMTSHRIYKRIRTIILNISLSGERVVAIKIKIGYV